MIQQPAPTGERVTADVDGRQKYVATARPDGLQVWCPQRHVYALVPYAQLMSVPTFRAGVLAWLAQDGQGMVE